MRPNPESIRLCHKKEERFYGVGTRVDSDDALASIFVETVQKFARTKANGDYGPATAISNIILFGNQNTHVVHVVWNRVVNG